MDKLIDSAVILLVLILLLIGLLSYNDCTLIEVSDSRSNFIYNLVCGERMDYGDPVPGPDDGVDTLNKS